MRQKLITRTVQSLTPAARAYDVRDTDLSGFLLRVLPSGLMSYYCDFRRPDGRRTRVKLGDASVLTPVQARDEALKIRGDLARSIDPAANKKAAKQAALQDSLLLERFVTESYRPWAEANLKTGRETVKRTLTVFEEFKNQRLTEITPWKIDKWRSACLKSGLAAATVNRNVTMLKSILQRAVSWKLIQVNPIAEIKPLKTDRLAKVRFLSELEEASLRKALDQREDRIRVERSSYNQWNAQRNYPLLSDLDQVEFVDHLKPMVLLSLNTGLRQGEVFNLKWSDIDFIRRNLTVVGKTAKSGSTRHISLNDEALGALVSWKAQSRSNQELVFPNRENKRFDNVQTSWESVLKFAEIENFRWHDMRHHFASMLVTNGVDLNTVRELLGHGDIKMTLRYAHLGPHKKAEAVATLNYGRSNFQATGQRTEKALTLSVVG